MTTRLLLVPILLCGACADPPVEEPPVRAAIDATGRLPEELPDGFVLRDLGEVVATQGETPDLEFVANAETRAFHVVAIGPPGSSLITLQLVDPAGRTVTWAQADPAPSAQADSFLADFAEQRMSPNAAVTRPRAQATLVPSGSGVEMQAGAWSFRVGVFRLANDAAGAPANAGLDTPVRVAIVERKVDAPATATIDLAFTFVPGAGLDASSAPTDPVLARAIALMNEAFAAAGISIGDVTYANSDAGRSVVELGGPSCLGGEVPELFDEVAAPPPGAVHVVVVDTFRCVSNGLDVGASLGAVSNGVPGIPFATRDGIVLATALKDDFPEDWALVLAHELGHFLGLFHTREPVGGVFDPISDTAERDPGAKANLMFFNVSQARSTALTANQLQVVRRSPAVR